MRAPSIAVSYSGLLGGAERVLLDMAGGLPEPPLIACPPGPLAEAARSRGLGVFELRERSLDLRSSVYNRVAAPARVAAQGAEVKGLVASVGPALLIAWGMRAGAAVATAFPRGRRPPLLLQHNDLLPGPLVARAVRRMASGADVVVAVSACVACDLDPEGGLAERLRVVLPGVDLERFRPPPSPPALAGAEVLVLGAIEPWKQPDLALEAAALAARELPTLRLRMIGDPIGPCGRRLLERLRRRAEQPDLRGRVTLAGAVSEPERALASAACLLHCAEKEPYGMVVAEALASGVPVVVPDSCGPAEIVDSSCGRLYPPGDAAAAARALVEVLEHPREAAGLGTAGRARAQRMLNLGEMQARYAELVHELAGGSSSRPAPAPASAPLGSGLAVVTVMHDSEREITALLDSLGRHLPGARVVVVDSGSADGGLVRAREWRDGAASVLELENVGFGRAVNAGLALANEPVTAVLNPDVKLQDASLAAAAREALREPERLIAPLVLRPDGRREDNAQHEPGSPALLAHALVPAAALSPGLAAAVEPWRSRRPRRVGWPLGSCVIARTEVLRRLGPFDERAFLYAEDLDLGLRAADAGIETWYWPAARVVHQGGHSTRRAFGGEPFELLARRRREVVSERRGPRRATADDLLQALTFADRLMLKRLTGRDAARERRQLEALRRVRREADST